MAVRRLAERAIVVPAARAVRTQRSGVRLFDEARVQHLLVAEFLASSGEPLRAAVPASAGVYGLRYHGSHPAYSALDSHRFVYVGRGSWVRERISSHAASLTEARDLEISDFSVVVVPLASLMHAEVAEHLLIGAFDPLWCRPGWRGFGSRPQGAGRRRQRPTDWDRRHPGRLSRTQAHHPDDR